MYGRTPEAAEFRQAVTVEAMQRHIGGCREWTDEMANRCNKPAEYVLWGKLIPPEALGPRCYDCAAKHIGTNALHDDAWAIVNLARLAQDIDKAHQR